MEGGIVNNYDGTAGITGIIPGKLESMITLGTAYLKYYFDILST